MKRIAADKDREEVFSIPEELRYKIIQDLVIASESHVRTS
jgi:hypothetical protein